MLQSMIPAQISLGPITLHTYGLIIGLAVIAAAQLAAYIFKKHGGQEKIVWSGFMWAFVGGLIGARMYHVIDWSGYYLQHPAEILTLWHGGLGIWGAIIGVMIAVAVYSRKLKQPKVSWQLWDAMAIAAPLGQAIGRWGNYVNQELYGKSTQLPWGIKIDGLEGKYQPLFLYESLLSLILLGILLILENKDKYKWGSGGYLGSYILGYGLIRLIIEPLRVEPWRLAGVPTAAIVAILMIILGAVLIIKSRNRYV